MVVVIKLCIIRKLEIMKKILLFISVASTFLFQGCYDDYKEDFEYTTTYFARQFPLRSLVEEEGQDMTFEVGAVLGGKYNNNTNEEVSFVIQDTLLNANNYPQFTMLPKSYYTLSSQNITIPKGQFKGNTTVTINKDLFMNDPLAIGKSYALPVEMVSSTADRILQGKHYSVIVIRYYNKYHGWYYVKGEDKNLTKNTSVVYSNTDLVKNEDMLLETTSKDQLKVPYVGNPIVNGRDMVFTISNGNVVIAQGTGGGGISSVTGSGTYDSATRNFAIEYSYTDGIGEQHSVKETLIYRNTELILEDWQ